MLVPSVVPSGKAFTAASAAAFLLFTVSFNAAIASASAWLIMPSVFASANAFSAAFSASSAAFTLSNASLIAASSLSLMPLLFASVTVGRATGFTSFTRPCNESFVLVPSVVPSGKAFTAASAAALVSATFAFNAVSLSASA